MKDIIAVILPVYHKDKVEYICLAVDSILGQTYQSLKVFIGVDGPVPDDIKDCLAAYGKDERVQVVWFEENRGLACVLNDLLELCFKEGFEYIARMDADDISLPERFEKQMAFLHEHPDTDVVGGASQRMDEQGTLLDRFVYYPESHEECVRSFATRNPLGHPAVSFRKSYFDKAGLYRPDHRINQDTLLWYDGLMNGVRMGNVQDVILYFRVSNDLVGKRRGGWRKAYRQLKDRLMINRGLHYGLRSDIYALGVFCYMVSPAFVRKYVFKRMR